MNRAFITLYSLVVASVIVIGWGLNTFWEKFSAEQPVSAEVRSLFVLLEKQLTQHGLSEEADRELEFLAVNAQVIPIDDFANSSSAQQLLAGEIIRATDKDLILWYKRIDKTSNVLLISVPANDETGSPLYTLLLIVFYAGIALVIYVWVLPLSRDVKKLERQTRQLGKDAIPETLSIAPTSAVYALAQAFNNMTERLRALINSHKEMTNAVSHELRTPLARMKFALAMLEGKITPSMLQKNLNSIQQDITDMESLISSLLMYAGFEQESQELQQCEGDMLGMLNDICQRFSRTNTRGIAVNIRYEHAEAIFTCEWKLLETVIQNLINNAARYAKTSIVIDVREDEHFYYVAVEDDGIGIQQAERQRVFESFVRLYSEEQIDATSKSGFGLGLAIVKRIMKWHHGDAHFQDPHYLTGARAEIIWPK